LKLLHFLLIIVTIGSSSQLNQLYQQREFKKICRYRWKYINLYRGKNEPLLSWVAYSCLKKGNIIPALDVAKNLFQTKEGRANSVYIATLFLIKKIIYQLIKDNLMLNNIKLPIIEGDPLGEAFKLISEGKFKRISKNTISVGNGKYLITALSNGNLKVEIYNNGNFQKKEVYW